MDEAREEQEQALATPHRRRLRRRWIVLVLLLAALLILWLQRFAIADNFIQSQLEARGVRASYEIQELGFGTQRLTNLVVGDPRDPDLTAREVDVLVTVGFAGAAVRRVEAEGVRIKARIANGALSLGELDKFRDPTSTSPLALPDMAVGLKDVRARLDTPWGRMGLSIAGSGHLRNGFSGEVAAIGNALAFGTCNLSRPSFYGRVTIRTERPQLTGPLRMDGADCGGLTLGKSGAQVDARLSAALDRWTGTLGLDATQVAASGWRVPKLGGKLVFDGTARATSLDARLTAEGLAGPQLAAQRVALNGRGRLAGSALSLKGDMALAGAALSRATLGSVEGMGGTADGTPVGPILRRLAAVLGRAGRQFGAKGEYALAIGGPRSSVTVSNLTADAANGAHVSLADAIRVADDGQGWRAALDGTIRLGGGGLPDAVLRLRGLPGGGYGGMLLMDRYSVDGASLAVPELRFTAAPNGTRFTGNAILSGPLSGGRVEGLALPLDGRLSTNGDFALWSGCRTLAFERLALSSLLLSKQRLSVCPTGGDVVRMAGGRLSIGARLPSPAIGGRLGGSPLSIVANEARIGQGFSFAADGLRLRLGPADAQTMLDAASLVGAPEGRGLAGRIEGASGAIARVPLDMSEAAGDWTFADGVLALNAGMTVSDQAQVDRFRPVVTRDVALRFANDEITATGTLNEPVSGRAIGNVAIAHRLSSGTGHADLNVPGLTFDERLQPEALTPLALGVVANVKGVVTGQGRIDWSPQGLTSTGTFSTDGADLAAAFGPVQGLKGTITFTDLLGLETAPGQVVSIGSVNPGVPAFDGVLRYRLLPGQRVAIEGGRWPFAGGELVLEPTVLDLGQDKARNLTFTVTGLDAAKFLQNFGFDNLQATGVFDGQLPMVFDADGGRIVGGRLVARDSGGQIAYVGELTYEDMGLFANYAFRALRSIRYRNLEIEMNGQLDGELITKVNFAGLQQGEGAEQNFVTKQIAKLPIQFNVTISAPFMQLIQTVRGYYNPELLVNQNLQTLLDAQQRQEDAAKGIQPPESEDRP